MSDRRPTRLPLRTGLGRYGGAVHDETPPEEKEIHPAVAEFVAENGDKISTAMRALQKTLAEQMAAVPEDDEVGVKDTLSAQAIALLSLGYHALELYPPEVGISMHRVAMRVNDPQARALAKRERRRIEKAHARGEDVSHLVPPGLGFNAKGKLVKLDEPKTPPDGGVQ